MSYTSVQAPVQTPHVRTSSLPHVSPGQASPSRSTPGSGTKTATVKALPTVRDHTTDQLGPEGDEYIAREIDPDGETKVTQDGYLLDGREYRCRTFQVPNRGKKLFMLATECARVLNYRDSYLLFNKNRSLYKIIANQAEKEALINVDVLPYSYRSRQIAIVTARSMFRQFGSRLIDHGRRVRDDYWEAKAKKQGFTEEDAAGEKRPGAAKAREAAAAEASQAVFTTLPQGEIIYSDSPGMDSQPPGLGQVSLAPLAMLQLPGDDLRPSAYGNLIRPRQEISGPPYQDRIQSGNTTELLTQAAQAAEYNKQLSQTRTHRARYLDDYWARPHEQPEVSQAEADTGAVAPQHLQTAHAVQNMNQGRLPHDQMAHAGAQMIPQGYPGYPNPHFPMASPVQTMQRPMQASQMHPNTPMGVQRPPSYGGYVHNPMWQTPQAQPSPLSQSHHAAQYAQQHQQQHHQSPMHPPPPQMSQQAGMAYAQMNPAFAAMGRNMYQPNHQQQFGMQPGGQQQQQQQQQQAGMQNWSSNHGAAGGMQDWQRYQ